MGAAMTKNVMKTTMEVYTSQMNEVKQSIESQQVNSQIVNIVGKEAESVEVSGISMDMNAQMNMKGVMHAFVSNSAQQNIQQKLQQVAKSLVKGINFGQFSHAENIVDNYLKASIALTNQIGQNCISKSNNSQMINVNVDKTHGAIWVHDDSFKMATKSMVDCMQQTIINNKTMQDLKQQISQKAEAKTIGLDLTGILMLVAMIALGLLLFSAGATVMMYKLFFPILILVGLFLLFKYWDLSSRQEAAKKQEREKLVTGQDDVQSLEDKFRSFRLFGGSPPFICKSKTDLRPPDNMKTSHNDPSVYNPCGARWVETVEGIDSSFLAMQHCKHKGYRAFDWSLKTKKANMYNYVANVQCYSHYKRESADSPPTLLRYSKIYYCHGTPMQNMMENSQNNVNNDHDHECKPIDADKLHVNDVYIDLDSAKYYVYIENKLEGTKEWEEQGLIFNPGKIESPLLSAMNDVVSLFVKPKHEKEYKFTRKLVGAHFVDVPPTNIDADFCVSSVNGSVWVQDKKHHKWKQVVGDELNLQIPLPVPIKDLIVTWAGVNLTPAELEHVEAAEKGITVDQLQKKSGKKQKDSTLYKVATNPNLYLYSGLACVAVGGIGLVYTMTSSKSSSSTPSSATPATSEPMSTTE